MPIVNPSETIAILRRHGIHLTKRLGQNFLVDGNILRQIVAAAEVGSGDVVLEVGPGIGTLTEALLDAGASVVAVEIDERLRAILVETLVGKGRYAVVSGDALHMKPSDFLAAGGLPGWPPNRLVSNLPYSIAAPLVIEYFVRFPTIESMVVMIQKEVADRILASPGTKEYGGFTAKAAFLARSRLVCHVSRRSFLPAPNVDSSVVRLDRRGDLPPRGEGGARDFFAFVDACFSGRRKILRNSLLNSSGRALLERVFPHTAGDPGRAIDEALSVGGVSGERRAEQLALSDFLRLFEAFSSAKSGRAFP